MSVLYGKDLHVTDWAFVSPIWLHGLGLAEFTLDLSTQDVQDRGISLCNTPIMLSYMQ